jgi:myo-inositol-1(or 4)-monophosphatase
VFVPSSDELFAARRGHGATLDGRPIRCNALADPATALLATGFSYDPARRARHARRLVHVVPAVRDIRRLGAASVDLCHVACGRVDAYVEESLGPWDLAAGELIAREAGCRTGDLDGGPPTPDQVLVTNPALFEPLAELLRRAWANA